MELAYEQIERAKDNFEKRKQALNISNNSGQLIGVYYIYPYK